jgi:CRISPR-associated protein Cmr5
MSNATSTIRKLEQGRAEFAYRCAEEGKKIQTLSEIDGKFYKDDKYKSYAKKFPPLIKTNGLGAALAFYYSKRAKDKNNEPAGSAKNPYNAYDLIYKQLNDWLRDERCFMSAIIDEVDGKDLLEKVILLNSPEYRAVTGEVLSFMSWVGRFAEGLIEGGEENE